MTPIEAAAQRETMSRSGLAWSWYQGGRDPYITLISIYIFMPYVATVMIGNAVTGQAKIAGFSLLGGVIAALTAPFLGAAADRMGRRLPPLKILSLLFAPLVAALWFAKPDGSGLSANTNAATDTTLPAASAVPDMAPSSARFCAAYGINALCMTSL